MNAPDPQAAGLAFNVCRAGGSPLDPIFAPRTVAVIGATVVCGLAVCGLAVATTGWMFGPTRLPERLLALAAALLLLYLEPVSMVIGGAVLAAAVVLHLLTRTKNSTPTSGSPQQKEAVTS